MLKHTDPIDYAQAREICAAFGPFITRKTADGFVVRFHDDDDLKTRYRNGMEFGHFLAEITTMFTAAARRWAEIDAADRESDQQVQN